MPRLPIPGKDQGTWGQILNDYLSAAHKPDGNLKPSSVPTTALQPNSITETKLAQALKDKLNQSVGATGASGASGTPGPQGATGAPGTNGTDGQDGTNGATGATGPQGPPGPASTVGATGATGAQGEPGATGAGATGPVGPAGADGTDGQDGSTGATGPQGATGPAGPQGDPGPASTVGATGATGAQGETGATGAGTPGVAGATGATGPQGATGAAGSQGATGATGQGVPTGGTTGQVLAKSSNANYATEWVTVSGAGGEPGIVELDSFAGANDDAKLTAALDYASSQSRIPWIRFPARQVNLNQGGRTPFTGMKLVGPGPGASSAKNYEVGGGVNVNHRINLQSGVGTGNNALFVSTSEVYSITVAELNFTANNSGQFWHQPSGTMYSCEFRSLNFYGIRHVFGTPSAKALMTAVSFTGFWGVNSYDNQATPLFHLGGSDNSLWMGGWINIGSGSPGNGGYIIRFDGLSKTNVGYIYLTARNGDLGIRCSGSNSGLCFFGGSYEGQNAGDPCYGNVIRVEGGTVSFRDPWLAYGMVNPTGPNGGNSQGMIHITGGQVLIDGPRYARATGVGEAVPMIYVGGGEVRVRNAMRNGSWSGKPRVLHSGGQLDADDTVTVI